MLGRFSDGGRLTLSNQKRAIPHLLCRPPAKIGERDNSRNDSCTSPLLSHVFPAAPQLSMFSVRQSPMDGQTPPALSARPYRSHRVPACDRCRQRKIRCNIDIAGQSCRFCRERNDACSYSQKDPREQSSPVQSQRPLKRVRQSHGVARAWNTHPRPEESLAQFPSVNGTSPTESSLMMNPPMAEDIAVLEQYLTSQASEERAATRPYSTISNVPGNPIVYLTVPRRRKGLRSAVDPGRTQREIIEQILSPFTSEVRRMYYEPDLCCWNACSLSVDTLTISILAFRFLMRKRSPICGTKMMTASPRP